MPELVSIPIAIFEITIEYLRPNIRLMLDRKDVVEKLFDGFKAWNIKVDDLEVIDKGKASEQGIKFTLPTKQTSFFFGSVSCKLIRDNADWASAEETIKILDVGLSVLTSIGGVEIGSYKTGIALHLQPKTLPSIDLLKSLAPPSMQALDLQPMTAVAAVIRWDKRRVTLDGSSQLANGVFVRFEREFQGNVRYEEIAAQLQADEQQIFDLLGVMEEKR